MLKLPRYELGDQEAERRLIAELIVARFCEYGDDGDQEPVVMRCLLTFSRRGMLPTVRAHAPASVGWAAKPVLLVVDQRRALRVTSRSPL